MANNLPDKGADINIVQETGDSESDVMSQKAVTEALQNAGGVKSFNDLEDKPFFAKTETVEILPESPVIQTMDYWYVDAKVNGLVAGDIVVVTYNGEQYEWVVENFTLAGTSIMVNVLGNSKNFNGVDTGDPIGIMISPASIQESENSNIILYKVHGGVPSTIAMSKKEEVVHHIDPKFIKDMYYTEGSDVVEFVNETLTLMEESSFAIMTVVDDMTIGETYTLTFNGGPSNGGSTFECVAQDVSAMFSEFMSGATVIGFGDMSAYGYEGNDEGFMAIIVLGGMEGIGGQVIAPVANLHLVISGKSEIVHKLDNKYLDMDWIPNSNLTLLAAEKTVTSGIGQPTETTYGFSDLTADMVHHGMRLEVYFDGVCHKCTVYDYGEGSFIAGNLNVFSDDNVGGVPFAIMILDNRTNVLFRSDIDDAPHVMSIYGYVPNKMPIGFMPKHKHDYLYSTDGEAYLHMYLGIVAPNINNAIKLGVSTFQFAEVWSQNIYKNGKEVATKEDIQTYINEAILGGAW